MQQATNSIFLISKDCTEVKIFFERENFEQGSETHCLHEFDYLDSIFDCGLSICFMNCKMRR